MDRRQVEGKGEKGQHGGEKQMNFKTTKIKDNNSREKAIV
jgi:hypothetical protein